MKAQNENEKHSPCCKAPPRRGIVQYIPPLRGIQGVTFFFVYSFSPILVFLRYRSWCLATPDEDENQGLTCQSRSLH